MELLQFKSRADLKDIIEKLKAHISRAMPVGKKMVSGLTFHKDGNARHKA